MNPSNVTARLLTLWQEVLTGALSRADAVAAAGQPPLPSLEDARRVAAELSLPDEHGRESLAELAVAAALACVASRAPAADRLLNAGLPVLGNSHSDVAVLGRVERLARWEHSHRWDDIIREADVLLPAVRTHPDSRLLARVQVFHAEALLERGRSEDALLALTDAATTLQEIDPDGPKAAVCQLQRGRALAALGRRVEAHTTFRAAADAFDRLKLTKGRERAERELASVVVATDADLKRVASLLDNDRYEEALAALDQTEPLLTGDTPALARCLELRGAALRIRGNMRATAEDEDALDDLNRAVELLRAADPLTLARCRRERAELLLRMGRLDDGVAELDAVLPELTRSATPDEWLTAVSTTGVALQGLGQTGEGLSRIRSALAQARRLDRPESILTCLGQLAGICVDTGQFADALRASEEAFGRLTEQTPPPLQAMVLTSFGASLLQAGRLTEAIVALETALPTYQQPGFDRPLAGALATLGQANLQIGRSDVALACFAQAEPLFERLGLPVERASLYTSVGLILQHDEQYPEAVEAHTRGLELLGTDPRPYERATILTNRATARALGGDAKNGLQDAIEAAAVLGPHSHGVQNIIVRLNVAVAFHSLGDYPRAVEQYRAADATVLDGDRLFRFHVGYAMSLVGIGGRDDGLVQLRAAVAAYRQARLTAGAGELALEFVGRRALFGEATVFTATKAGDDRLAFELGQVGKGALAQEFLAPEFRPPCLETPNVLATRELVVGQFLTAHDPSRYPPPDGPEPAVATYAYLAESRAAELVEREKNGPTAVPLEAEQGRVIETVQAALPDDRWAVLDLWQIQDEMQVFIVTGKSQDKPGQFRSLRFPLADPHGNLARRLPLLAARLANPEDRNVLAEYFKDGAENVWDDIHSALFAPQLQSALDELGVTGLYLVPHGMWHGVPLHAARRKVLKDGRWARKYLCERYTVAYLPSAAALPHLPPPRPPTRLLSLTNPDHGTANTLPFAEWEAERLWPLFRNGARLFARGDATTDAADWRDADFVHFGCHGVGEPSMAGLSRLYLAGDCLLGHDVLYRRGPLRSGAVVVLNGCQTGVRDWRAVDEGLGLMTAFLLRGAGAVLSTQWNVPDHFAARVVDSFARAATGGRSPVAALNGAVAAARRMTPDEAVADCSALSTRYNAAEYPHESARVLCTQAGMEEAAGRTDTARELRSRAAEIIGGNTCSTMRGVSGFGGAYDNELVWAVFQLTGRVA